MVLSSIVENLCFSAYSCSARCGDFNEPKNIENGFHMQKLWRFSYRCFCSFWVGRNLRPQESPASGTGVSSVKILPGLRPSVSTPWRLSKVFGLQTRVSGVKFLQRLFFSWGHIKDPLSSPKCLAIPKHEFLSLPPLLTLESLPPLNPSHDS